MRGPLIIFAVIILANILYVSGTFKSNPLDQFSGLANGTVSGLTAGYNTIDPNDAYTTQALGHEAARDLRHGSLPWWNYDEQVGAPLAGEMQSAALFLPFVLLLGLSGGVILFHILLELIGSLAAYYLFKKLKFSERIALIGGILFALNGTFSWISNAAFNPVAFLPLLILAIEIVYSSYRTRKIGGWILIAVALAFSLYAGFPETAFLDGLFVALWVVVRALQLRDKDWLKFVLKVTLGAVVGVLLAVPILIAFKDYYPYADIGIHAGALKTFALPRIGLPALLMPYIYGPIFDMSQYDKSGALNAFWGNVGGYLTFSLLFFAIAGVVARFKKQRILISGLVLWIVLTIARTYGFPGLASIFNIFPGISLVAFYRYVPPSFEFAVLILAMFGLDGMIKQKLNRKQILSITGGMFVVLLILLLPALQEEKQLTLALHHHIWLALSVLWGLGSIACIALAALYFKKYLRIILPLIIVVDALVMFIVPQVAAPRTTIIDTQPVTFLKKNLGNERFYSMGPIRPNYGSYYGVASINTNDLPIAKTWSKYVTSSLNSNADPISGFTGVDMVSPSGITPLEAFMTNMPAYENVGVKYVAVIKGAITQPFDLRLVFSDDFYQIYELNKPAPYFQVVSGDCKLTNDTVSRTGLTADCSKPSDLLRRELFMPGWTVSINNKSEAVRQKDGLFQKVSLPKGKSNVSFSFAPIHIKEAEAAFVVGVIIILGFIAREKIYPKRLK